MPLAKTGHKRGSQHDMTNTNKEVREYLQCKSSLFNAHVGQFVMFINEHKPLIQ